MCFCVCCIFRLLSPLSLPFCLYVPVSRWRFLLCSFRFFFIWSNSFFSFRSLYASCCTLFWEIGSDLSRREPNNNKSGCVLSECTLCSIGTFSLINVSKYCICMVVSGLVWDSASKDSIYPSFIAHRRLMSIIFWFVPFNSASQPVRFSCFDFSVERCTKQNPGKWSTLSIALIWLDAL